MDSKKNDYRASTILFWAVVVGILIALIAACQPSTTTDDGCEWETKRKNGRTVRVLDCD